MTGIRTAVTWTSLTTDGNFTTKYLKVIDGWLVRVEENTNYNNFQITHVSDPEHQWIPTDTDDS